MRIEMLAVLLSNLWSSISQDGIIATIRKILRLTKVHEPDSFDIRYGIDTSKIEPLWRLSIDSKNVRYGFRYEATSEDEFTEALDMIPCPFEQLTFIDLGCGKGRTLIMAAEMRFAQVIGVEFAKELVETARKNLSSIGLSGTIVQQDAAEFEFPNRDLVVYMYNPFGKEVMIKVLNRMRATLKGVVYIIYKVPECADLLDKSDWLTSIGSPHGRNYIRLWKSLG